MTDSQGISGAIAFGDDRSRFVAAFFMEQCARSPFLENGPALDEGLKLLQQIPLALHPLVEAALPHLEFDVEGLTVPLVSSVFWTGLLNGHSTSSEPWEDVYDNGASLICRELLDEEAALEACAEDMDLGDAEIALVAALHRRRLANASGEIALSPADVDRLHRFSRGPDGIQACAKALRRIGISSDALTSVLRPE